MPGSVLVAFASTHGHTARIADRLARAIRSCGLETDVCDVGSPERAEAADPDGRAAVVVAGSLHGGQHQGELGDWVRAHRSALHERPCTFVSVSLTAADAGDEAQEETRRCIDVFHEDTDWWPERSVAIAGALQYREYDVFTRTIMRLMMSRGGHPTDISHDHDFTDWDGVDRLGEEIAARAARG